MPTGVTFYDPKEAKEYASGLQKQGWQVTTKMGKARDGQPVWVVVAFGTVKTAGRQAPTSLAELYAGEEVAVQRAVGITPKQVQRLAKMPPEKRTQELIKYQRRGVAKVRGKALVEELKLKEATAREVEGQLAGRKPLLEKLATRVKTRAEEKAPYAVSAVKAGIGAGGKAVEGAREVVGKELSPKRIVERASKSMARQGSMRKVIPVAAGSKAGYTYLARIGKVAAPAISEASYPAQDTIAQTPPQASIAQIPTRGGVAGVARASIAEAPTNPAIVSKPKRPRIASATPVETAGTIAGMPYLREQEEEVEEPSSG